MSTYKYAESSRRYYTEAPKIIQSRGSSSDSRASYDSTSSTDQRHASSKSSMGYYGGSQSKVEKPVERIVYRAPDAETKRVESITRGNVEVIHQRQRIYDPEAPLSSDATSSHYRKDRREHGTSRHSSHKHSSHRR